MPYLDLPSGYSAKSFINEIASTSIDNTDNIQIAETYQILRSAYARAAIGSESTRHSSYFLIDQTGADPVGEGNSQLVRYTLTYAHVPVSRNETVITQYTYPGIASGAGQYFQRYGLRRPVTLEVNATDAYDYFVSTDGSGQTLPALSIPTLDSEVVDFFGAAYDSVPPYDSLGNTDPLSEPSTYTVSFAITRWKGNIWQKVKRTVPSPAFIFG